MSPRKIKCVISDFHLGAGHWKEDGTSNILEDFFHDREFIEFLSYFGQEEADDVELIINGDFFNILQIDFDEIDPDVITELVALRRMKKIIEGHKATINALRYFYSVPNKKITFVMGNHDPGILFPSIQELLREKIGPDIRFFLEAYEFDGVYVEHGNQYEIANCFDRHQYFLTKDLPQPVINQPWGTSFLVDVVNQIKIRKPHFDKVQPFGTYMKWLVVYDFRFAMRVVYMILSFFAKSAFMNDPRRRVSFRETFKVLIEAPVFPDLDEAAERILLTRDDVHTVIFGHNHRPTYRQFAPDKEYFNAGTWNEMTHLDIERLGNRLVCSFVMIEYQNNRPRASLKVWKGSQKLCATVDVA